MKMKIPTSDVIRARMAGMNQAQIKELADKSGVPFTTLLKIKRGETPNPGVNTAAKFFGLIKTPKAPKVAA